MVVDGVHGAGLLAAGWRWPNRSSTSAIRLMALPDLPVLPEPLRGRRVPADLTLCGAGAADSAPGWAGLDGLPSLLQQDCTGGLTEWYATLGNRTVRSVTWQAGRLLSRLDEEGVEALLHAVHPDRHLPVLAIEVRRLGGRLGEARADAVGGRDAAYLLNIIGVPRPIVSPEVLPAAFADLEARLEPWLHGGTQVNFHGPVSVDNPLARAWPTATADRLAAVRRVVDPYGLFAS